MTPDEPRGPADDAGATIIIPKPKNARMVFEPVQAVVAPILSRASGLNPLVRAANPLIELVLLLRQLPTHPNVEELRAQLVQMVRTFEAEGRACGLDDEKLGAARYCLCTFIDEVISSTPWGAELWASRSLLVTFHNEASGGERVFFILPRLARNPLANIDVLELLYIIFALGFEGRYRLIEGGRAQLDKVIQRLEQMIREQRGTTERDLSLHWAPVKAEPKPLLHLVPLWVAAAIACALLILVNLVLSFRLNDASDEVFSALHSVRVAPQQAFISKPTLAPKLSPKLPVKLAEFLTPEIARVTELSDRIIVTIRGDGLFASGSTELNRQLIPLIQRIGDVLREEQGSVVVAGHADNQRLLSARFPSNWHLSQARAEAVRDVLVKRTGASSRFTAEGRGDAEPIAPNDSSTNRAKNRRVDITILAPGVTP